MQELKEVLGMLADVLKSFAEGMGRIAGRMEALAEPQGDAKMESQAVNQKSANTKKAEKTRQPVTPVKKRLIPEIVKPLVKKTALKLVPEKKDAVKQPVQKIPVKAASEKKEAGTATDTVFQLISGAIQGIDVGAIMEKSGFDKKKVFNILHRLKQQGKIKSTTRGMYSKKG